MNRWLATGQCTPMALVMLWAIRLTRVKSTTTWALAISTTTNSLTSSIRAPSSRPSVRTMDEATLPTAVCTTNSSAKSAAICHTIATTIIKSYCSRPPPKTSSKISTSEQIT